MKVLRLRLSELRRMAEAGQSIVQNNHDYAWLTLSGASGNVPPLRVYFDSAEYNVQSFNDVPTLAIGGTVSLRNSNGTGRTFYLREGWQSPLGFAGYPLLADPEIELTLTTAAEGIFTSSYRYRQGDIVDRFLIESLQFGKATPGNGLVVYNYDITQARLVGTPPLTLRLNLTSVPDAINATQNYPLFLRLTWGLLDVNTGAIIAGSAIETVCFPGLSSEGGVGDMRGYRLVAEYVVPLLNFSGQPPLPPPLSSNQPIRIQLEVINPANNIHDYDYSIQAELVAGFFNRKSSLLGTLRRQVTSSATGPQLGFAHTVLSPRQWGYSDIVVYNDNTGDDIAANCYITWVDDSFVGNPGSAYLVATRAVANDGAESIESFGHHTMWILEPDIQTTTLGNYIVSAGLNG